MVTSSSESNLDITINSTILGDVEVSIEVDGLPLKWDILSEVSRLFEETEGVRETRTIYDAVELPPDSTGAAPEAVGIWALLGGGCASLGVVLRYLVQYAKLNRPNIHIKAKINGEDVEIDIDQVRAIDDVIRLVDALKTDAAANVGKTKQIEGG